MPIIIYIKISINHQIKVNHRMIVLTLIWMTKTEHIMNRGVSSDKQDKKSHSIFKIYK